MPTPEIENAIAEITNVLGKREDVETVWIYGQMMWATVPDFEFEASRGRTVKKVRLMAEQVKRYRDGESNLWLIELPATMATVLGLDDLILPPDELERLKKNIDTSRAW